MYSVARGCAKGELDNCGCDRKIRINEPTDDFEWGGCSDNVRYGNKFSREFVDSGETKEVPEGLMNLWNNEAGRKVNIFLYYLFF